MASASPIPADTPASLSAAVPPADAPAPAPLDTPAPRHAYAKNRAPRIASHKVRRLTFTGVAAVPDEYGRLRILLQDRTRSGAADLSWALLRDEIPKTHGEYHVPYELWATDPEGLRGVVRVTPPAHLKAHWIKTAAELRGLEVRVEATLRPYSYAPPRRAAREARGAEGDAARTAGMALDLALLEALGTRAP